MQSMRPRPGRNPFADSASRPSASSERATHWEKYSPECSAGTAYAVGDTVRYRDLHEHGQEWLTGAVARVDCGRAKMPVVGGTGSAAYFWAEVEPN